MVIVHVTANILFWRQKTQKSMFILLSESQKISGTWKFDKFLHQIFPHNPFSKLKYQYMQMMKEQTPLTKNCLTNIFQICIKIKLGSALLERYTYLYNNKKDIIQWRWKLKNHIPALLYPRNFLFVTLKNYFGGKNFGFLTRGDLI